MTLQSEDHASGPKSEELRTRTKVLAAVLDHGPVSASALAKTLKLTPAAIRRHLDALEDSGQIEVRQFQGVKVGRGRPARQYVVTSDGHAALGTEYDTMAIETLKYIKEIAGAQGVAEFARRRMDKLESSVAPVVNAAGPDLAARSRALAGALTRQDYSASATPVAAGTAMEAMQLCQGHCPIQDVAAEFGEFCEVERESFARLLGVDVRRLSTLANGDHVCTTHIPTSTVNRPILDLPTSRPTEGGSR